MWINNIINNIFLQNIFAENLHHTSAVTYHTKQASNQSQRSLS